MIGYSLDETNSKKSYISGVFTFAFAGVCTFSGSGSGSSAPTSSLRAPRPFPPPPLALVVEAGEVRAFLLGGGVTVSAARVGVPRVLDRVRRPPSSSKLPPIVRTSSSLSRCARSMNDRRLGVRFCKNKNDIKILLQK